MNKLIKYFLYSLLFFPIISYFLIKYVSYSEYLGYFYLRLPTIIIGFIWFFTDKRRKKLPPYLIILIIYILYLTLWDIYNGNLDRRGVFAYIANHNIIPVFIILMIIENNDYSDQFIKTVIKVIKLTVLASFIVSVIQIVVNPSFFTPDHIMHWDPSSLYLVRRFSIFGYYDPNGVGLSFLPLLSVLIGYQLYHKQKYLIWLIMGGVVSIATNGRYILVGYVIVLVQIFIFNKISIFRILRILFSAVLVILILLNIFKYFGYDFEQFYEKRLFAEQDIRNTSRYLAYEMFLEFFPRYYLLGTGEHLTEEIERAIDGRSSQIHVGYFSHLVSYGIVGSFFLFTFWYLIARRNLATAIKTKYYGSFFAFLIFLWANLTLVFYSVYTYGLIFAFIFQIYFYNKANPNLNQNTQTSYLNQ